jgi:hypothetical protein
VYQQRLEKGAITYADKATSPERYCCIPHVIHEGRVPLSGCHAFAYTSSSVESSRNPKVCRNLLRPSQRYCGKRCHVSMSDERKRSYRAWTSFLSISSAGRMRLLNCCCTVRVTLGGRPLSLALGLLPDRGARIQCS